MFNRFKVDFNFENKIVGLTRNVVADRWQRTHQMCCFLLKPNNNFAHNVELCD